MVPCGGVGRKGFSACESGGVTIGTTDMLTLLQEVAEEVITPRFRSLRDAEVMSKTHPGDLVTVADQEAEVLITRALRAAYPDAVVLGEEAYAQDHSLVDLFRAAEHAFTVDPVDGTKNFVGGSPDHAVMVAEVLGGETVRSWIWQPQHERAYVAERGAGVYRDGQRMAQLEPAGEPGGWRVRTSAPPQVGRPIGPTPPTELTWLSCGIDYPQLAEGACDALVYRGTHPWDHVPGALLLQEVGGVVGDVDGSPYGPRSTPRRIVAAASEEIYSTLAPLV